MAAKITLKELGLDVGSIFGSYFLKTENMHYGYWSENLDVRPENFSQAQDAFSQYLKKNIPQGVKTILDVGCGSGQLAHLLIDSGYEVDCVSPSPYLSDKVRKLTENKAEVYDTYYESLETKKRYDLVLFSESFQYIKVHEGIQKSLEVLNPKGYILICDFFRKDVSGKSPISGGHNYKKFQSTMKDFPLELMDQEDITAKVAPTICLISDLLSKVGRPLFDVTTKCLLSNKPWISRLLMWKFKAKIEKMNAKFFSGAISQDSFSKFKTYQLLVYRSS